MQGIQAQSEGRFHQIQSLTLSASEDPQKFRSQLRKKYQPACGGKGTEGPPR